MRTSREDPCPECGDEVLREEVDIGVGVQTGPYGCFTCGWSEWPQYDCRKEWANQENKIERGGSVDPLGGWTRLST